MEKATKACGANKGMPMTRYASSRNIPFIVCGPLILACVLLTACTSGKREPGGNLYVAPSAVASAGAPFDRETKNQEAAGTLTIWFLPVGQGDCTLVELPNGEEWLIDCGSTSARGDGEWGREEIRRFLSHHVEDKLIERFIISHPDADHYNLIPLVFKDNNIAIREIYIASEVERYSKEGMGDWIEVRKENIKMIDPDRVNSIPYHVWFSDKQNGFHCDILAAATVDSGDSSNEDSIVIRLRHKQISAIITGDATFETEDSIIERKGDGDLRATLLRVGHHGSRATSTSDEWARETSPKIAVYSAGWDNSYGHPALEVGKRLEQFLLHGDEWDHPMRFRDGKDRIKNFRNYKYAQFLTAVNGLMKFTSAGDRSDFRWNIKRAEED